MKNCLLFFFLFLFSFLNAQSGKHQVKLGGQIALTPYLSDVGIGYHGEYEYSLNDRFSIAIGLGQVAGKEVSTRGSSGFNNGSTFDYTFDLDHREVVNYLEGKILIQPFKVKERNHFKTGFGFTVESIAVDHPEKVLVVNGLIQEWDVAKHVAYTGTINLLVENDYYITPSIFINVGLAAKIRVPFSAPATYRQTIEYRGVTGLGGGGYSQSNSLSSTVALVIGAGYRF